MNETFSTKGAATAALYGSFRGFGYSNNQIAWTCISLSGGIYQVDMSDLQDVCPVQRLSWIWLETLVWTSLTEKKEKNVFRSCSPGPSHPFVVVLRVHGQYGDPRANVDQQHGEGVVQGTGLFHAALGVWWVLEVVALWVSIEAHPVNVQQAVDQAIQLIKLQQLQVGHLQHKWRRVKMLRGHYFIW